MAQVLLDVHGNQVKRNGEDVYTSDFDSTWKVTKAVDKKRRTLTIVGSDETRDRMSDIIMVNGWDLSNYLNKNPVFLWAHDYWSVPIGRAESVQKKRNPKPHLLFKIKFPTEGLYPFADLILDMYEGKFINASSVGFIPTKREDIEDEEGKKDGIRFLKQELLELSGCPVPCNPNALQDAITGKSFGGDIKPEDLMKCVNEGGIEIPCPVKADDVMEELRVKELKVEIEDQKVQVVVPEEIEEIFEEEKEVKEEVKEDEEVEVLEEVNSDNELLKEVKELLLDIQKELKEISKQVGRSEEKTSESSEKSIEDKSEGENLYDQILTVKETSSHNDNGAESDAGNEPEAQKQMDLAGLRKVVNELKNVINGG